MSGDREARPEPWAGLVRQAGEAYDRFRRSRLPFQLIASVCLVAAAWTVSVLPQAPVDRVRQALTWTVTHDYDFAGRWNAANRWATGKGGWRPALAGLWESQLARLGGKAPFAPETKLAPAQPGKTPAQPPAGPEAEDDPAAHAIMPVDGRVLYGYGWLPKGQEPHGGLDLSAPAGTPVVAIADGTVIRVGTDPNLGALVEVDHGFAVALYGQIGGAKVKAGDQVKQGQALAAVAKPTGKEGDRSSHLHLEIRTNKDGKTIDPAPFLPLSAEPRGGDGN
ncbi:MAG TPA: M23 family metallopeptidase [Symbiobacteriaceae bacterium]|nr:M23 family metallopeptidase [Symbiobacteriaceae bacterium]